MLRRYVAPFLEKMKPGSNSSISFVALFFLVAFIVAVIFRVFFIGNSLSDTAEYGADGILKLNELNVELEKDPL